MSNLLLNFIPGSVAEHQGGMASVAPASPDSFTKVRLE